MDIIEEDDFSGERYALSDFGILVKREYLSYLKGIKSFNKRVHKIYSITDPRDWTVFYIGCTVRPIHLRMYEHLMSLHCFNYIGRTKRFRELIESGKYPTIDVLYEVKDKTSARIAEKYITHYVNNYGHINHDLTNVVGRDNVTERVNLAR